jgi:hypothetical protein
MYANPIVKFQRIQSQTGSTALISAANTAAPRAVCKNDGNSCAFYKRMGWQAIARRH